MTSIGIMPFVFLLFLLSTRILETASFGVLQGAIKCRSSVRHPSVNPVSFRASTSSSSDASSASSPSFSEEEATDELLQQQEEYDALRYKNRAALLEHVLKESKADNDLMQSKLKVLQDVVLRLREQRDKIKEEQNAAAELVQAKADAVLKERLETQVKEHEKEIYRLVKEKAKSVQTKVDAILQERLEQQAKEHEKELARALKEKSKTDQTKVDTFLQERLAEQSKEQEKEVARKIKERIKETQAKADALLQERLEKQAKQHAKELARAVREKSNVIEQEQEKMLQNWKRKYEQQIAKTQNVEQQLSSLQQQWNQTQAKFEQERLELQTELSRARSMADKQGQNRTQWSHELQQKHYEQMHELKNQERARRQRIIQQAQSLEEKLSDATIELNKVKQKYERLRDEARAERSNTDQQEAQAREISALKQTIAKLTLQQESSQQKLTEQQQQHNEAMEIATAAVRVAERRQDELEAELSERNKAYQRLQDEMSKLEDAMAQMTETATESPVNQTEAIAYAVEPLKGEISDLQEQIRSLKLTHQAEMRSEKKRAEKTINALRDEYEEQLMEMYDKNRHRKSSTTRSHGSSRPTPDSAPRTPIRNGLRKVARGVWKFVAPRPFTHKS